MALNQLWKGHLCDRRAEKIKVKCCHLEPQMRTYVTGLSSFSTLYISTHDCESITNINWECGCLQINFNEYLHSQVGDPWIMGIDLVTEKPPNLRTKFSIYCTDLLAVIAGLPPAFLKGSLTWITRTSHSFSRCSSLHGFLFCVFRGFHLLQHVYKDGNSFRNCFQASSFTLHNPYLYNLHSEDKQNCFSCWNSSSELQTHMQQTMVSRKHQEANVHKIEFMIFLYKTWTYKLKNLWRKETFIAWVLGNILRMILGSIQWKRWFPSPY